MMEVVMTTGAVSHAKLKSNHHHQQTNIQLFTVRMPFLSPNQQCQSTEGKPWLLSVVVNNWSTFRLWCLDKMVVPLNEYKWTESERDYARTRNYFSFNVYVVVHLCWLFLWLTATWRSLSVSQWCSAQALCDVLPFSYVAVEPIIFAALNFGVFLLAEIAPLYPRTPRRYRNRFYYYYSYC